MQADSFLKRKGVSKSVLYFTLVLAVSISHVCHVHTIAPTFSMLPDVQV